MKKTLLSLLCGTILSVQAQAGLNDALLAYQYQQYSAAFAEFSYLQEEGDPIAAYYLGRMFQLGQGVSVNLNKAIGFYRMADAGYYFPASAELGKLLVDQGDIVNGIDLLHKAALAGEIMPAYELGNLYAEGKAVEKDPNLAFGFYKIAALGGNMKAQYQIAKMYFDGRGVPQDYENARKWLSRSANQGYVLAQVDLAEMYANDKLLKNLTLAYKWYSIIAAYNSDDLGKRAAEKRDILLRGKKKGFDKKNLGSVQAEIGKWKPKTPEQSVPQEERLQAELPNIDGFNDPATLQEIISALGFLPRGGLVFGVTTQMVDEAIATQNVQTLLTTIEESQKNGQIGAYGYLGDLFKTRLNNATEAFLWYQKGAEAGDVYAQYQLARMFCEGEGISQPDAASCYAWLVNVQKSKDPTFNVLAQNALSVVRSNATPDELSRGQALSEELDKKNPKPTKSQKSSSGFL